MTSGPCSTRLRSTSPCGRCGDVCCMGGRLVLIVPYRNQPLAGSSSTRCCAAERVTVLNQTPTAFTHAGRGRVAYCSGVQKHWRALSLRRSDLLAARRSTMRSLTWHGLSGTEMRSPRNRQHVWHHRNDGARDVPAHLRAAEARKRNATALLARRFPTCRSASARSARCVR